MSSVVRSAAASATALAALALVRPGLLAQSARSPLAWLTLAGVLLLVAGARRLIGRTVGARAGTAAGVVVALAATLLLVGPSFRQRTLNEALPAAELASAVAPPAASPTSVPAPPAARRPAQVRAAAPSATTTPARPATARLAPAPQVGGRLRGINHAASGHIVVFAGAGGGGLVRFQDVDIEGSVRPSVHLVPYGTRRPTDGVRLGGLKAERGSFSYRVPSTVDLHKRWTVLVWCDPYDVPIAAADLG